MNRALACFLVLLLSVACKPGGSGADGGSADGGGTPIDGDCERNAECASGFCAHVPGERTACRLPCAADGTCAAAHSCTTVDGVRLCLPLVATLPAGSACRGGRECASGACVESAGSGICVEPCLPNGSCTDTTLRCAVEPALAGVPYCMPPTDVLPAGNACSSGRECAGGRCVPWGGRYQCAGGCEAGCGDAGAICDTTHAYGSACVVPVPDLGACGDPRECVSAICFAVDGGAVCVGPCGPDQECPPAGACLALQGGARACTPLVDTRPVGTACDRADQCASGRCARFGTATFDGGVVCADPCDGGACTAGLLCWGADPDAGRRGLCGPDPY
ncbi:MAG: hypothetical protein HY904_03515 [Deltaproteobacteria bacterium]|nr:hypothetical protein [Deltaproteobacteria bacterium]